MVYFKRLIIFLLLFFIIFFNFSSVFATEEEVETIDPITYSGLYFSTDANYIRSANNIVRCFPLEKGYIYTFTNTSSSFETPICFSYETPSVNVLIYDTKVIGASETFSFIANDYDYLYFNSVDRGRLTRVKIIGQDSAINDLVENVGPNAFWGVFGSGLDFVFIVVIVAFGLFIIYKLIKGFSKGKSKI